LRSRAACRLNLGLVRRIDASVSASLSQITPLELFVRLGIAALLGAFIGFERQWRQRSAGLHTTSLVAIGAALFTLLDIVIGAGDTTRIVAGVVTGVGFIAGGVILRTGANVSGLNTAATMWATAAVGALAGFGFWPEAFAGAAAILLLNCVFQPVADAIDARAHARQAAETIYKLSALCRPEAQNAAANAVIDAVSGSTMSLQSLERRHADGGFIRLRAEIYSPKANDRAVETLCGQLLSSSGIEASEWQKSTP
jgi:putative Mg2+ transporter-C (MgtC) family protein